MNDGTVKVRIVWRVADCVVQPSPTWAMAECSRCQAAVYTDAAQPVPPGFGGAVPVCVPCAMNDPELRPGVERVRAAAMKLGQMGRAL